jgi:hypothetical protein
MWLSVFLNVLLDLVVMLFPSSALSLLISILELLAVGSLRIKSLLELRNADSVDLNKSE